MIKLTKEDLGKKFNSTTGFVMEVLIFGSHNVCAMAESGNMDVFSHDGINDTGVELTSRYDSRQGLKDMPDLGDIKDGWIACDSDGNWLWYSKDMELVDVGWLACDKCGVGDSHEVTTDEGDHGFLYCGDTVKCGNCGHAGVIDADREQAWVDWSEIE